MSAGDVNLQRIFFVFRIFFSVAAAATAVARTFPVYVCGLIIFIFGRRLWRCDAFSSLLFLD
jgi:hypothetical protein